MQMQYSFGVIYEMLSMSQSLSLSLRLYLYLSLCICECVSLSLFQNRHEHNARNGDPSAVRAHVTCNARLVRILQFNISLAFHFNPLHHY